MSDNFAVVKIIMKNSEANIMKKYEILNNRFHESPVFL